MTHSESASSSVGEKAAGASARSAQVPAQRGPTPGESTGHTRRDRARACTAGQSGPSVGCTAVDKSARYVLRKLPQVTGLFWVLKILAVTLGEAGGDELGITLKLGYLFSAEIFFGFFLVVVVAQVRATRCHPALFWAVILASSLVGTEISDGMDRGWLTHAREVTAAGVGYATGAGILAATLVIIFLAWWRTGQTYDVENIATRTGEMLYWAAILVSNTLGTAFGDWLSAHSVLGSVGASGIVVGGLALIALAYWSSSLNATALFWLAFILTRPLGAAVSDSLVKPASQGGAGWGTLWACAVLLAPLIILIIYQTGRLCRYPLELLPMPVHRLTGQPLPPNGELVTATSTRQRPGQHLASTAPVGPAASKRRRS